MSAETGSNPIFKEDNPPIRVVDSIGLARDLLTQKNTLKPHNSWMGITTSKKTYPDEMVLDFAKWSTKHSNRFMVVIADGMQVYNKMAMKGTTPNEWSHKQIKHFSEDIKDYRKDAKERQQNLQSIFRKEGLKNVRIKLLSRLLNTLRSGGWQDKLLVDYFKEMTFKRGVDNNFDQQMDNIVKSKVSHIINMSPGDKKTSEFIASLYCREEIVLIMSLSSLGIYKYLIKVGPEGEREYDQAVLDIFRNGFGKLRDASKPNEDFIFGAVYLK
jgi:hypothetical protein